MRNFFGAVGEALLDLRYLIIPFVILWLASTALAAEVPLSMPYANFTTPVGAYSTTLVLVNPTAEPISVPRYWEPVGYGTVAPEVPAFGVFRFGPWPKAGGGVATLYAPDSLIAYTEVEGPTGFLARFSPSGAIGETGALMFQDIHPNDKWQAYLFLYSPDGTAYTVRQFNGEEMVAVSEGGLAAGETQIPLVAGDRILVNTGWRVGPSPQGTLFAFLMLSHQPLGELFDVKPTRLP